MMAIAGAAWALFVARDNVCALHARVGRRHFRVSIYLSPRLSPSLVALF